jgi:hypothetical protein
MKLEGSCHCQSVRFTVESKAPYPYAHCYCSICRKTQGGAGAAVNLHAFADTLQVQGMEYVHIYQARIEQPDGSVETSPGKRHFCSRCGSALWVFDPRWPDLLHPFASAIDTPLPTPPERVHLMLNYVPAWVFVPQGHGHLHFPEYPDESLEEWHKRHGLWEN